MKRLIHLQVLGMIVLHPLAVLSQTDSLPDPTRPAQYSNTIAEDITSSLVEWKVTAIRISENDRTAIVNGRIARAGDTIGTAKLLEILPHQVILEYDNRKVSVKLLNSMDLRKPATNTIKTESRS